MNSVSVETITKAFAANARMRIERGDKVYRLKYKASGKYLGYNFNLVGKRSAKTIFDGADVNSWLELALDTTHDDYVVEVVRKRVI